MTEPKDKNIFEEEEKPIKKQNSFFKEKKKGTVVSINKKRGKIVVDVKGNGELLDYIEERHSALKIGDPIEL